MYFRVRCSITQLLTGQIFLQAPKCLYGCWSGASNIFWSKKMKSLQALSACSNRLFWTFDGSKCIWMSVKTYVKEFLGYKRLSSTIWVTFKILYLASFCSEIIMWPRGTPQKWSKIKFSKSSRQLRIALLCFWSAILACVALLQHYTRAKICWWYHSKNRCLL